LDEEGNEDTPILRAETLFISAKRAMIVLRDLQPNLSPVVSHFSACNFICKQLKRPAAFRTVHWGRSISTMFAVEGITNGSSVFGSPQKSEIVEEMQGQWQF